MIFAVVCLALRVASRNKSNLSKINPPSALLGYNTRDSGRSNAAPRKRSGWDDNAGWRFVQPLIVSIGDHRFQIIAEEQ